MRRILTLSLLLGAVALVGACDDDDDNGGGPNPSTGTLRVIHGSPDAPAMDILVDGTEVVSALGYQDASAYVQVDAGTRSIEAFEAGTTNLLFDIDASVAANTPYTLVASDVLANVTPVYLTDNNAAPATGQVRVRAMHGSPSTGAVDVHVTGPADPLGTPTFTNVPFGDVSDYLEVPAGTYRVRVTPTGTATVALDETYVLVPGQVRTIVALDGTGVDPVELVVYADAGPATAAGTARFLHASPDGPAVDAVVDGSVFAADLGYEEFSGYVPVASGVRDVMVVPSAGGTALIDLDVDVTAGSAYTVLAVDSAASIAGVTLTDDLTPPGAGNVRVRAVHAAAGAGNADVYVTPEATADLTGLTPDVADAAFGAASGYLEVPAGTYRVWVTAAGDQGTVLANEVVDLSAAGAVRTVVAVDDNATDFLTYVVMPDAD